MNQPICIIGTDTAIGKTYVTTKILNYLNQNTKQAAALKPIASGWVQTELGWLNEDVYQLFMASNLKLELQQINPFLFKSAIAPHLAAAAEQRKLSVAEVVNRMQEIIQQISLGKKCDYLLIEGVGGLMVPLNSSETYLDLLKAWNYPLILVVGMKLGCLNHALLSEAALKQHGINLSGWIANHNDPTMLAQNDNLDFLSQKLNAPLLATLAHNGELNPCPIFKKIFA